MWPEYVSKMSALYVGKLLELYSFYYNETNMCGHAPRPSLQTLHSFANKLKAQNHRNVTKCLGINFAVSENTITIYLATLVLTHIRHEPTKTYCFLGIVFCRESWCQGAEISNTESNDDVPDCVDKGAGSRMYLAEYTVSTVFAGR